MKLLPPIKAQIIIPLKSLNLLWRDFLQHADVILDSNYITILMLQEDFQEVLVKSANDTIDKELTTKLVDQLNNLIKSAPHFDAIIIDNTSFQRILYNTALTLASYVLLNPIDPYTQDIINPENQVVVSSKHQFDVESLFNLLRNRPLRLISNPHDRQPFCELDKQTIVAAAKQFAKRENKNFVLSEYVRQDDHDELNELAIQRLILEPREPIPLPQGRFQRVRVWNSGGHAARRRNEGTFLHRGIMLFLDQIDNLFEIVILAISLIRYYFVYLQRPPMPPLDLPGEFEYLPPNQPEPRRPVNSSPRLFNSHPNFIRDSTPPRDQDNQNRPQ